MRQSDEPEPEHFGPVMLRVLAVGAGLLVGAGAAQFPEFSQQYVQRLGGAVDELRVIVADFDRSATDAGLSRDEALGQMTGTAFLDNRRADMTRTFERVARLEGDLMALQNGSAFSRATQVVRFRDRDIARKAMQTFQPAVPLTVEGFGFAGLGFAVGWAGVSILGGLFRRRRPRMA